MIKVIINVSVIANLAITIMKVNLIIFAICIPSVFIGQNQLNQEKIDSLVNTINIQSGIKKTFRGQRFNFYTIEESTNNIQKISKVSKKGPKNIIETFYIHNNKLIFSTVALSSYYFFGNNDVTIATYYCIGEKISTGIILQDYEEDLKWLDRQSGDLPKRFEESKLHLFTAI